MIQMTDLFDADRRVTDPVVLRLAEVTPLPNHHASSRWGTLPKASRDPRATVWRLPAWQDPLPQEPSHG